MVKLIAEMVPILVILTIYALCGTGSKSTYLSSNKHHIILTSSSKQICTPSKMLLGCNVQHNRTLGSYNSEQLHQRQIKVVKTKGRVTAETHRCEGQRSSLQWLVEDNRDVFGLEAVSETKGNYRRRRSFFLHEKVIQDYMLWF